MCSTCGCSGEDGSTRVTLVDGHRRPPTTTTMTTVMERPRARPRGPGTVLLEQDILAKNDLLAAAQPSTG